jgi:hypothetical protein
VVSSQLASRAWTITATAARAGLNPLTYWRASSIPDRGPNKVPSGMEGERCKRIAVSTVLSSRPRRRG